MYIFYTIALIIAIWQFYPQFITKTIHKIKLYRRKLKNLKFLATTKHTEGDIVPTFNTHVQIYLTCVMMLFHHLYVSIFQALNKSVVKINKNTYELTYMLNDNTYKILVKTNIGPQPKIIQALDELDNDITETIRPFFGPIGNFHGITYTPKDFNIKNLTLNMSDTKELTFNYEDTINFTKIEH